MGYLASQTQIIYLVLKLCLQGTNLLEQWPHKQCTIVVSRGVVMRGAHEGSLCSALADTGESTVRACLCSFGKSTHSSWLLHLEAMSFSKTSPRLRLLILQ